MNKQRRSLIADVIDRLETIRGDIEIIRDEEQDAFDNMPEGIQESDRGQQMEEYIGLMEDAMDEIDSALENLGEVS